MSKAKDFLRNQGEWGQDLEDRLSAVEALGGGGAGTPSLASVLGAGADAGGHEITDLADPTSAQSAATKAHVAAQVAGLASTAYVDSSVSGKATTAYVDSGDATTLASAKAYTDANAGGGAAKSAVAVIAPADATSTEKARADYVCDGVDDHVEWHQAMADLGSNGGKLAPMAGNFVGGQVVLQNRIAIDGAGMRATRYQLKAGVNSDAFINFVSPDGITANAEFCAIMNMCIDANKAQQTAGNGVVWNANPTGTKATNDTDFDTHQLLFNVEILNAFQDGFQGNSRSEHRLINVYSELAGRYAFNPSYDTFFSVCVAAHAGLAGFYVQSSSVRAVGCKAFYSGAVTPGSGNGLWIKSIHGVVFEGFEAQDNKNAGVLVDTSSGCRVSGSCDSNSTRGVASAPALDMWAATNNVIDLVVGERKADGTNSFQQNALRLRTGCAGNDIRLSHSAFGGASIGTALMAGSDPTATGANRVYVNGAAV
jgi:hypothetical protein